MYNDIVLSIIYIIAALYYSIVYYTYTLTYNEKENELQTLLIFKNTFLVIYKNSIFKQLLFHYLI